MASQQQRILSLESITWSGYQLHIDLSLDGVKFPTVLWYGFKLDTLHQYYGDEFMERVYFLIAGMQLIKIASLKPDVISISSTLEKYYTLEFKSMWEKVLINALGQWRFKNNLPNWEGPCFMAEPKKSTPTPCSEVERATGIQQQWSGAPVRNIVYSGGGKDGLLSMKLQSLTPPTHIQSVAMARQVSKSSVLKKCFNIASLCSATQSLLSTHFLISQCSCGWKSWE